MHLFPSNGLFEIIAFSVKSHSLKDQVKCAVLICSLPSVFWDHCILSTKSLFICKTRKILLHFSLFPSSFRLRISFNSGYKSSTICILQTRFVCPNWMAGWHYLRGNCLWKVKMCHACVCPNNLLQFHDTSAIPETLYAFWNNTVTVVVLSCQPPYSRSKQT